ncbi:MAG: helix-turn-helix domain-containing protein [Patescibacteria group bacterium]
MAIELTLKKLGLNQKEIEVYLASLQLGTATITELSRKSDIKRPTTYLIIESLLKQGLISIIKKKQKTYYAAERPKKILTILKARQRELEQSLPELEALYNSPKHKPKIQIYEGLEAVSNIYDQMYSTIGKNHEALFFTAIGDLLEHYPEADQGFQKILMKAKNLRVRELNYGDNRGIAHSNRMKKKIGKYHKIRNLDPKIEFSNTDFLLFKDELFLFSLKEDIFVIHIHHQDIANSYRALFEWAWKMGKNI